LEPGGSFSPIASGAEHGSRGGGWPAGNPGEQTFEGRRENLNQANKLSRSYAVLLDALNRRIARPIDLPA
jgi:hypothetical protein